MRGRGPARLVLFAGSALFLLWRFSPAFVETLQLRALGAVAPAVRLVGAPGNIVRNGIQGVEDYLNIIARNRELRMEIQMLRSWRETALRLEEENTRLRALNRVRLGRRVTYITGEVVANAGGPFLQRVLVGLGAESGVQDGAAVIDGNGLVGRISGVGTATARILLLTDPDSRVPIIIRPSGRRAILTGDNSRFPRVEYLLSLEGVNPGDRVLTTGDGSVLPSNLYVGRVVGVGEAGARVGLAADYERLEFVRILSFASPGSAGELVPFAHEPVRRR